MKKQNKSHPAASLATTAAALLLIAAPVHGAEIVYDFNASSAAATTNDFGNGITADDAVAGGLMTIAEDRAHRKLEGGSAGTLAITINIPSGVVVDLTALDFVDGADSGTGSNDTFSQWDLTVSTGSVSPDSGTDFVAGTGFSSSPNNVTLSGLTGLTDTSVTFTWTVYYGTVDGDPPTGGNNNNRHAFLDDITLTGTIAGDSSPPEISAVDPENGTGTAASSNLVATFNEDITLGTGNITIKNLTETTETTIDVENPAGQLSVAGGVLTINPAADLDDGDSYAVRIAATAVDDLAGNSFAGILDDVTWAFVIDSDPPLVDSTDPADNATDIPPYATLTATFSEDVKLIDGGTITIRNVIPAIDELVLTLPDSRVSVSGADLSINLSADNLDPITEYAVQVSSNAVEDLNGNAFVGIADDTTWSFTTAAPPSGGIEVTPDHIVSGSVTGTLLAIDVPFQQTVGGGPDWPDDADDGFTHNDDIFTDDGTSNWEPDGTPIAEARAARVAGNGPAPSVTWAFTIPDGTVINAVYATWNTRGSDGITWQYNEGAASDSATNPQSAAPASDLVLRWTDASAATHDGNFQQIFAGPITVAGGDGFTLWGTANQGNAAHIDAIVLDVSGKAVITSFEGAGATGVIDQGAKTIALEVPFGTDLATLAPTFTLSSGTCDQTSGAVPSPDFATQNPVDYVVTDTSTDPDTVKTYAVTVTVGPEIATLVIDLGTSPAGTTIEGGTFIGSGPTNLPLPALPVGSILQSIAVDAALEATDNENWASDLSLLLDPTPGSPGGDFSVEITNGTAPLGGAALDLDWPTSADAGPVTPLIDTKTDADWAAAGPIDLATTGLFLGNAYGGPTVGGTWSGTITLTYEVGSGGSAYSTWSGGEPFAGDKNGDGVPNGLAFLLGAADPDADALGLLPTVSKSAGGLVLNFSMLNAANRGTAALSVEHSNSLATGSWTTVSVPDTSSTVADVVFTVTGTGPLNVTATIPVSKAASGKLFGRLKATE